MKLLFDENLSPHLVTLLADAFPQSIHADHVGLHGRPDLELWQYARVHGLILVSKDSDFHELSALFGSPPKVIWLAIGNRATRFVEQLLRQQSKRIEQFAVSGDDLLELRSL